MLTETLSSVVFNLGSVDRIPLGEGREYQIGDEEIAIFHARNGALYAVQARCPHREGHLADGIMGNGQVICPMHAYKFELATGASVGDVCEKLKTYPVQLNAAREILLLWSAVTA